MKQKCLHGITHYIINQKDRAMKRQYMNYMKSNLLVVIACFISMAGAAQGFSPAAMEQLKVQRLWAHSQNAAGMVILHKKI